jgi:isochorismate hydrolase
MTALDAVCMDFNAVIVADACTAYNAQAHEACLDLYRKNPLRPMFTVQTVAELLAG